MYLPTPFAETDTNKLYNFMHCSSFAVLISQGENGPIASHLPLLLDAQAGSKGHILGHMARANPHWRQIEGDVLVVYSGPHVYISPSWYEAEETVPTWNYVAVHAYGSFHLVEDREELLGILEKSVQTYESSRPEPWSFDASAGYVEKLLKAIVGFRIEITRLEGKWKLSQNHLEERRRRVVLALESQADENSNGIASLMRERLA